MSMRTVIPTPPPAKAGKTLSVPQSLDLANNPAALLNMHAVRALVGLSRSTIYAKVNGGSFPPPAARLGQRCTRWRLGDVLAWLKAPR